MTKTDLNNMLQDDVKLKNETKERLNKFLPWRLQKYQQHGWKRSSLSEAFAEDFQYFGGEDFKGLIKDIVRDIQDYLQTNRVYVQKGHGVRISQSLADVIKNDLLWPEDDDDCPPPKQKRDLQIQEPIQPPQPRDHKLRPVHTQGQADEQIPLRVVNPIPNYQIPHLLPLPYQILQNFKKDKNHGHGRELATLAKMYISDDNKYSGSPTESLNYKFTIFIDQCKKAEIPSALLPMAFPTML